jgi:hypothetical protein
MPAHATKQNDADICVELSNQADLYLTLIGKLKDVLSVTARLVNDAQAS